MFFVSLLCIALFTTSFAHQVPAAAAENEEEDASFALYEAIFSERYPLPYQMLEFGRKMLGIDKNKMMKFAMKALEIASELPELWSFLVDLFRKETPKTKNAYDQHYSNQFPTGNAEYYYGY